MMPQILFDYFVLGMGYKIDEKNNLLVRKVIHTGDGFKTTRLPGGCVQLIDVVNALGEFCEDSEDRQHLLALKNCQNLFTLFDSNTNKFKEGVQRTYITMADREIQANFNPEDVLKILESSKLNTLKRETEDETGCTFSSAVNGPFSKPHNNSSHTKFGYVIFDMMGPDVFEGSGESEIQESSWVDFIIMHQQVINSHRNLYKGLLKIIRDDLMKKKIYSVAKQVSQFID